MRQPSLLAHLRDILLLPFTVTVIVPYLVYDPRQDIIPDDVRLKIAGFVLLIPGLALFLYTVALFRIFGNGTLAPWTPTRRLVITGPYRYCRNPMITGVFFILLGESLILHSSSVLLWATLFFFINTVYFIVKEEPDLLKRFGADYLDYKANVPRWIPRLTPYKSS